MIKILNDMNKVMNVTTVEELNTVTHENSTTEATVYEKPTSKVIEMEIEGAILQDSARDGGYYGRD